jgi:hypothetical protein
MISRKEPKSVMDESIYYYIAAAERLNVAQGTASSDIVAVKSYGNSLVN